MKEYLTLVLEFDSDRIEMQENTFIVGERIRGGTVAKTHRGDVVEEVERLEGVITDLRPDVDPSDS